MKSISIGGQQAEFTTAPVSATPAYVAAHDPEFLDAVGLQARFGIRRSLAYSLLADGAIRGVSLRRRNHQTKGKRLFCVSSVREYLNRQMQQQLSGEVERAE